MSREIKFRFVDTGDGTVYQPITLVELLRRIEIPRRIVLESENGHWVDTDDFLDLFEKGELIIEQDTGLKDKNGKEICEGDIIRCHGDDRFIAPVIRHDNSGGFCWVSCYKEECFIPESDEVEVIGNIHENPELIEKEKE